MNAAAALKGVPDDLPLEVSVAEEPGGDTVGTQIVTGAGFGISQWGDERGEQVDRTLTIECEYPTGRYYRRRRDEGRP
ncbi:DUF6225 family protein [Tenggerimyces flavus]|uniref:DUF6225 family protein n=1 Tax=Tenggerimyces flavus TaxID=1708749 RepID=A0ABV7Y520_9ACTN|nr:DUF6225 family protein [Tenggerimyces flavus]MBM7790316.1 hypothetical protein [Tenggerimyces flavus]